MYYFKTINLPTNTSKTKTNIVKKLAQIVDTRCGWFYNRIDWFIQEGLYVGNDDRQHPGQPRKLPASGNTQGQRR